MNQDSPTIASSRSQEIWSDALRYWEWRRIFYNLLLLAVFIFWVALAWPLHGLFRLFTPKHLFQLLVLAVLANVYYCAAYAADLSFQFSAMRMSWLRWRWSLWLGGTLFALLLASYWLNDEILPFLH